MFLLNVLDSAGVTVIMPVKGANCSLSGHREILHFIEVKDTLAMM